jgi:hypothetical protein
MIDDHRHPVCPPKARHSAPQTDTMHRLECCHVWAQTPHCATILRLYSLSIIHDTDSGKTPPGAGFFQCLTLLR